MSKLDWSKARRPGLSYSLSDSARETMGERWLAGQREKLWKRPPSHRTPRHKDQAGGIWIVQGAASPTNTTGFRQVRHFKSVRAAHKAGFTWVKV